MGVGSLRDHVRKVGSELDVDTTLTPGLIHLLSLYLMCSAKQVSKLINCPVMGLFDSRVVRTRAHIVPKRMGDQVSSLRCDLMTPSHVIGSYHNTPFWVSSSWDSRVPISVLRVKSSTVTTMICGVYRRRCSTRHETEKSDGGLVFKRPQILTDL